MWILESGAFEREARGFLPPRAEARLSRAQFELRQRPQKLYANLGTVQLQNHAFLVLQLHAAGTGRERSTGPDQTICTPNVARAGWSKPQSMLNPDTVKG
jgi:hypothetical protein